MHRPWFTLLLAIGAGSASAQKLTIAWRVPLGGAILAPVALAPERVVIVDRAGRVRAYEADQATVVAAATLETEPTHAVAAGEHLFVLDQQDQVNALDRDLKLSWTTGLESPVTGAPGAGGGLLVVPVEGPALVALDAKTGRPLWRQTISGRAAAAPLVNRHVIAVPTTDGLLELLAPDGGAARPHRPNLGSADGVTPAMIDDVLVAGARGGPIIGVDPTSGKTRWRADSGRGLSTSPLAFGDHFLVATLADQAMLLKPDGNPLWRLALPARLIHAPAPWRESLVMVPTRSGELLIVGPINGRIRARLRAPDELGWFTSAPTVLGERILAAAGYGRRTELIAIERAAPPPPAPDDEADPLDTDSPIDDDEQQEPRSETAAPSAR